jgi:intein/homing endonuclease
MEYNSGILEGTTVGTTPRGGHYNLVIGDDPLRDDQKYTYEFISNYYIGTLKPTTYTKKARYIILGCVNPETKIITDKGIEEIGDQIKYEPNKKELFDFKKKVYGKDGWDDTSKFFVNGKCKTKKITLECGYELECSEIHPLWTCISPRRGVRDIIKKECCWVKSAELKLGDKIALKCGTKVFGKTATISDDLAYFYGLYTAEGCVYVKGHANRITISNTDKYCVDFVKNKFGFISQDSVHHRKNSKELVGKMRDYGVSFCKCYTKRVPKKLMLEPKNVQTAFLQGLYDGDGHRTFKHNKNVPNSVYLGVVLTSTSKRLLQDVQTMLLNYGIISGISSVHHKGHFKLNGSWIKESDCFSLECSGKSAINFMKEIGFRIDRKNNVDLVAINFNDNVRECFGFVWRKVKKIEDSSNYTVDFVIPKSHSFITNGIVSHNTPQDIDDLFHTLMNDKIDKNGRPIGNLVTEQISASGFYCMIYPAILNDATQEVLVPEVWTYEELMKEKEAIGEIKFNREMLCRVTTYKNSLIGGSLFRSCCDGEKRILQKGEKGVRYIIYVDSATSDSATADYYAMTVWEDDTTNNRFILRHLIHYKGQPVTDPSGGTDDQTNDLLTLYKNFKTTVLPTVIIEKNNAGIALIQSFKAVTAKMFGSPVDVIEHYTHSASTSVKGKAEDIIHYIEQGMKAGVIVFPADPEDIYTIDTLEKIKTEHLNFGVKKGNSGEKYEALAGHDDIFCTCFGAFKYRGDQVDTLPSAMTLSGGNNLQIPDNTFPQLPNFNLGFPTISLFNEKV